MSQITEIGIKGIFAVGHEKKRGKHREFEKNKIQVRTLLQCHVLHWSSGTNRVPTDMTKYFSITFP